MYQVSLKVNTFTGAGNRAGKSHPTTTPLVTVGASHSSGGRSRFTYPAQHEYWIGIVLCCRMDNRGWRQTLQSLKRDKESRRMALQSAGLPRRSACRLLRRVIFTRQPTTSVNPTSTETVLRSRTALPELLPGGNKYHLSRCWSGWNSFHCFNTINGRLTL